VKLAPYAKAGTQYSKVREIAVAVYGSPVGQLLGNGKT
jgi:hypothetical protein